MGSFHDQRKHVGRRPQSLGSPSSPHPPTRQPRRQCCSRAPGHLLMNGLEELTLVPPNPAAVRPPHQPGVFVDEPRLPEHVGSRVPHLPAQRVLLRQGRKLP